MPGPYRAAMGKRDVAASWRAAYMRLLPHCKIKASCITTDAGGFCIYSNGFTAWLVVCAVAEAIASGMARAAV